MQLQVINFVVLSDSLSDEQRAVTMIPAHDSPVAALTFNYTGTKLATASEKVCHITKMCWTRVILNLCLQGVY